MAWIQDKKEVEVVDLVLRLREKLVNFVLLNEVSLLILEFLFSSNFLVYIFSHPVPGPIP